MAKFNLLCILNEQSQPEKELPGGMNNKFEIKMISVFDLEPSKENFYSVADIEDLKDSVKMFGVQQNLVVKPILGTNKYQIIAGHRRRLATLALTNEGNKEFELVPCKVEHDEDEVKQEILLIHINSTIRDFSDYEKAEQLSRLKKLFKEYKKTHKLPGRIRDMLAETLKVSPTQVGRIESINDNLIPAFKEEFKNNNITFSAASTLSHESIDVQEAAFKDHKEHGTLNKDVIKAASVKKPKTVDVDTKVEHYQIITDGVDGKIYNTLGKVISAINKDIKSYIYILKGEGSKTPVYAIKTVMMTPTEFKEVDGGTNGAQQGNKSGL